MEEKKINELIENIEIFLETSARTNEEVLNEIRELKNDPKEARILNEAIKQHQSMLDNISGLISSEKRLIDNFNPTVEHRHNSIYLNNPLKYFVITSVIVLLSIGTCFLFWHFREEERKEKEYYQRQSDIKDWHFMEYKYLMLFGDRELSQRLKDFDKEYRINYKKYDEKVVKREKQIEELNKAKAEAELRTIEAERAKRTADSLNNL